MTYYPEWKSFLDEQEKAVCPICREYYSEAELQANGMCGICYWRMIDIGEVE